jgi:hypothetical protein
MVPELERHLQYSSRLHLVLLLQELVTRHPELLTEVEAILEQITQPVSELEPVDEGTIDSQITDDWDFSGEDMTPLRTLEPALSPPSLDLEAYRQRLDDYVVHLKQKKSRQARNMVRDGLSEIWREAEQRDEQDDYQNALDLYGILLDERIAERDATFSMMLDSAIDEHISQLSRLLSDASCNMTFDTSATLSPLLTPEKRRHWLERLFKLWLKRLERHRAEEDVSEIIFDISWADDGAFLRQMVESELQRLGQTIASTIVDLTRQYRARALEKFLRELPMS